MVRIALPVSVGIGLVIFNRFGSVSSVKNHFGRPLMVSTVETNVMMMTEHNKIIHQYLIQTK